MTRMLVFCSVAWIAILVLGVPTFPTISVEAPALTEGQISSIMARNRLIAVSTTLITATIFVLIIMSRGKLSRVFVVCVSCALWLSQMSAWIVFREVF